MIILDQLPFRFVENVWFRLMMSICYPSLNMSSHITIVIDVYHIYVDERVKFKECRTHSFQRACLTTNTWTLLQMINYMVINAHFIYNDWKLHKKILNFFANFSHKGDHIALVIGKCLYDWCLASKLYAIIVDNAESNSNACTALIGEFQRHAHFLFSSWEFYMLGVLLTYLIWLYGWVEGCWEVS